MKNIQLNETPVRTSKNFHINHIAIPEFQLPTFKEYKNLKIVNSHPENIEIEEKKEEMDLSYGIGEILLKQVAQNSNTNLVITIKKNTFTKEPISLIFEMDQENDVLVDQVIIHAEEGSYSNIILNYCNAEEVTGFHNGFLKTTVGKQATLGITTLNLFNTKTKQFYSTDHEIEEKGRLNFITVDFGGEYSISNYYVNLKGNESKNALNTVYLGKNNQILDLNYITELQGQQSEVEIEVQGALKDKAKKNFKGTINFKKGAKKAKGNENEFCMLLSKTTSSLALPMLLCTEEEVEGNHSSASGKIDENKLFYLMTRGISENEAKKMIVKANFNEILKKIPCQNIQKQIIQEIDRRLEENEK